jgi:alkylation response protein AidB-like acyl-CoA dehydrogenase
MTLMPNADQQFFAETTQKFIADRCPSPVLREWAERRLGYDGDWWVQGAELGWTSPLIPEELGGGSISGAGLIDLTLIADSFGRHAAPGPLGPVNTVVDAIARDGTTEQREQWLDALVRGASTAAWCYSGCTPAGSRSDVALTAQQHGDGFVLDGVVPSVMGATGSDVLLVPVRTASGLAHLLVPTITPGVALEPLETLDLVQRIARVTFAEARVGAEARLGEVPADHGIERALLVALVLQVAESVGAMGRMFDMTLEWTFDRHSFGRPLASYQAIKHRFADMRTWLEASRATAEHAARAVQDDAENAAELVSIAKAYVADRAPELAHECIQFHGGIGVTMEHDLHLYARRVIQNAALLGTARDHRQLVAQRLEEEQL